MTVSALARRTMTLAGRLWPLLVCPLFAVPTPVRAQDVAFEGRGTFELDRRIRAILEDSSYLRVVRDTTLAGSDTLPGPVLVVGASAYIEGAITGDLVIIDANVFLRRTARVSGDVLNIGGGYFPSPEAAVAGELTDLADAPYDVVMQDDVWHIVGMRRPATFLPDGFRGLRPPRYDRVDGLTAGLGAGLLLPPLGPVEPLLHAWAEYHTERENAGGGATLSFLRGGFEIGLGVERVTATNDGWIRGPIHSGLSYLTLGDDYRNYHAADRTFVFAALAGLAHADTSRLELRLQREDARSLGASDVWSIRRPDSVRPNPEIDDGRTISFLLAAQAEWLRPSFVARLDGLVEVATSMLGGEHEFGGYRLTGEWAMPALADHTLSIRGRFMGPLPGTDSIPRQRWSMVGGASTLYTFDIADFRGSRVVHVATEYSIPMPEAFRLPIFGQPSFEIVHVAGMAWSAGEDHDFEQNIGLRIGTPIAFVRAFTDPSDFGDEIEVAVGLRLPRRLPWRSGTLPE